MNDANNAASRQQYREAIDDLNRMDDKGVVTPKATAEREAIAETIWRAELRRATGRERNIPWSEVSDKDRDGYRYIADAILARLDEAAIRAAQREIDAKIAEEARDDSDKADNPYDGGSGSLGYESACDDIASAIRGGKQP